MICDNRLNIIYTIGNKQWIVLQIYLHLDDNPNEDDSMKWWCFTPIGNYAVKKYNQPIEYYSSLHNVDTNLIKTIVFLENACGHYFEIRTIVVIIKKGTEVPCGVSCF